MNTSNIQEESNSQESSSINYAIAISIFILTWLFVGLIAFIWSLICFGRSGSAVDHIMGFIIAVIFGPFFFIYYAANKNYCNKILP